MIKISKQELILLLSSTIFSVVFALFFVSIFAPKLLDSPLRIFDSKQDGIFFDNIFRNEDFGSDEFIIEESYTHRAIPLYSDINYMGPNDILGFRNRAVPNKADFITIGDSQTYGNNVVISQTWPYILSKHFDQISISPYSMAVGGWGALDYLNALKYALYFKPKVIVVAFYTGNDPIETFKSAYSHEYWASFRFNKNLTISDAPSVAFPPLEEDHWEVVFEDGVKTIFTSEYRSHNVMPNEVIDTAFDIMLESAKTMSHLAERYGVKVIFTIIPTKEMVYAKKIEKELSKEVIRKSYQTLIENEQKRIHSFSRQLSGIKGAVYVDVVSALQEEALKHKQGLYLPSINGHPLVTGHAAIARSLSHMVGEQVVNGTYGPVAFVNRSGQNEFYLVKKNQYWKVGDTELFLKYDWGVDSIPLVKEGFFRNKKNMGNVTEQELTRSL